MARVGKVTTKESPALEKLLKSNKIEIISVYYKEKQHNARMIPRSGRRVGNDVYVDIERIPSSVRVKFLEDGTFREIFLNDLDFFNYLEGKMTKGEFISIAENRAKLFYLIFFGLAIFIFLWIILK